MRNNFFKKIPSTMVLIGFLSLSPVFCEQRPDGLKQKLPAKAWAPDHILVKFRPVASASSQHAIMAHYNLSSQEVIQSLGIHKVTIPANVTPEEMAEQLKAEYGEAIEYAEVDHYQYPLLTPNDPSFSLQYHLPKISAPSAWDSTTGRGITIAIADTGMDPNHPDLMGHTVAGYNVADGNNNTNDQHGHGTAVAGTAAAIGNNGIDGAGGAYDATLMPIKIVSAAACVSKDNCFSQDSWIASAITYAADHGAKVCNVSFGNDFCDSQTLLDAGTYMQSKGGLVVKAAGNSGINRGCSTTPQLIIVSATDSNDNYASFTNYGNEIAVSAPGVSIWAANCNACYMNLGQGSFYPVSGTSFSSPLTASVVALIFAVDRTFAAGQAQRILLDSADHLGTPGFDIHFGNGRINAARAVQLAQQRSKEFQLGNLTSVYAYPNPWDARRSSKRQITIANMPDTASVKIFTLSGYWVKTLTPANGLAVWDLTTDGGDSVASGLYFYLVKTTGGTVARGKIAIIK